MNQEILTKNFIFQNFSYNVHWYCSMDYCVKIALISLWNDFCLISLTKCASLKRATNIIDAKKFKVWPFCERPYRHTHTHAHVTRRVMLLFLESVTTHSASAVILKVTLSLLACVVCTCQVGFRLEFPLSSKLSALKTTYQFQNMFFYLPSISVTNGSMYNSRKRQFSAVKDSMCDDN